MSLARYRKGSANCIGKKQKIAETEAEITGYNNFLTTYYFGL